MKKLTLFLLVFISIISCGQSYFPFPESNAIWKNVEIPYPPGPFTWYSSHHEYLIDGDSMINNISYSKVFIIEYDVECSQIYSGPNYYGSLRNDSIFKKVYFIPYNYDNEVLLYDFSLEIGDTVPEIIDNYNYPDMYVLDIDSMYIYDTYRTCFYYYVLGWPIPIRIIEGIGAETGLFEPITNFEQIHYLRCFHQSDTLYYINPDDTSCVLETDTCIFVHIKEECKKLQKSIHIFPNPCSQNINISNYDILQNAYIDVVIMDLQNRIIYKERSYDDYTNIELSNILPGYYIITVSNEDDKFSQKILKLY